MTRSVLPTERDASCYPRKPETMREANPTKVKPNVITKRADVPQAHPTESLSDLLPESALTLPAGLD